MSMTRQKTTDPNRWTQLLETLAREGFDGMKEVLTTLLNEAMRLERTAYLGVEQPYQRSPARRSRANGFKPKTLDSRLGRLVLDVPQARDGKFYPACLEKGQRSERALKLAVAEMYLRGVSTRKVHYVMEKICGLDVSSAQVSRAAALLDAELARWRERALDQVAYLVLDAHYEKARVGDRVLPCAVLIAVGVLPDGRRMILGATTAWSEAEANWREFLFALQRRGMHGVRFAVGDDHAGLKAALASCLPGATWQRCQFHLVRNALHKTPRRDQRAAIAKDLRHVLDGADRPEAQCRLMAMADKYHHNCPKLAEWLEANVPESFAVYDLPEAHRKPMRTSNMLERLNREIARRTRVVGVFPHQDSLLRLVTALAVEQSEEWEGATYLEMNVQFKQETTTP
jgi:transposase-like protein